MALWPSPSGRQWGRLSITLFLTGLLKARHTVEEGGGVGKNEGWRGQEEGGGEGRRKRWGWGRRRE